MGWPLVPELVHSLRGAAYLDGDNSIGSHNGIQRVLSTEHVFVLLMDSQLGILAAEAQLPRSILMYQNLVSTKQIKLNRWGGARYLES